MNINNAITIHNGTATINHRELGARLGYAEAENYKHFKSFVDTLRENDGSFRELGTVSATAETGVTTEGNSYTRTVYLLTRRQTLYVIAKGPRT